MKSLCKQNVFWKGFEISRLTVAKLLCKRNELSEWFEISNRLEFTLGLMQTCSKREAKIKEDKQRRKVFAILAKASYIRVVRKLQVVIKKEYNKWNICGRTVFLFWWHLDSHSLGTVKKFYLLHPPLLLVEWKAMM